MFKFSKIALIAAAALAGLAFANPAEAKSSCNTCLEPTIVAPKAKPAPAPKARPAAPRKKVVSAPEPCLDCNRPAPAPTGTWTLVSEGTWTPTPPQPQLMHTQPSWQAQSGRQGGGGFTPIPSVASSSGSAFGSLAHANNFPQPAAPVTPTNPGPIGGGTQPPATGGQVGGDTQPGNGAGGGNIPNGFPTPGSSSGGGNIPNGSPSANDSGRYGNSGGAPDGNTGQFRFVGAQGSSGGNGHSSDLPFGFRYDGVQSGGQSANTINQSGYATGAVYQGGGSNVIVDGNSGQVSGNGANYSQTQSGGVLAGFPIAGNGTVTTTTVIDFGGGTALPNN